MSICGYNILLVFIFVYKGSYWLVILIIELKLQTKEIILNSSSGLKNRLRKILALWLIFWSLELFL